jgi:uncharacterized membrane protein
MGKEAGWNDRKLENVIGNLLRTGVLISALVVLVGAIVYLSRHGHSPVEYRIFRGEPIELRQMGGILREALSLKGRGIIQLGLLLLIATPVARVGRSILGFAAEQDWMYVGFASIVLVILLYSLFGSFETGRVERLEIHGF